MEAPRLPRVKPAGLRPGDTVGIVGPASNIQRESLEKGCRALTELGYKPFYFDSILEHDLYFAGSIERRVDELEQMFLRDEVRAVICARGGYGANYLLSRLNLNVVHEHPKIFLGYSDVTSLLTWFTDATGLVTFHGPMAAKDWAHTGGVDLPSWSAALGGLPAWRISSQDGPGASPLIGGEGEGVLYGGCLSLLVASLGTPYEIQTAGTILFIEDVATKPYQIDRMLMQLKLAGKLKEVRGVVFGEMLDCVQSNDQPYRLQEVITRIVGDLGVPVAFGLRSGHVSTRNITLPIGVRASLQVEPEGVTLNVLEAATSSQAVSSQAAAK